MKTISPFCGNLFLPKMGSIKTFSLHSQLHFHQPKFPNYNVSVSPKPSLSINPHQAKVLISSKLPLTTILHIPTTNLTAKHGNLAKFLYEKVLISLVGAFIFLGSIGCNARPSLALHAQASESSPNTAETTDTQMGKSEDEAMYEKLLVKEPKNVEVLKMLVYEKMRKRQNEEALKYVDKLIAIEPEEVEWRLLEALCYEMMGQLSRAKRLFKEILEERPLLLRALHGLAMVMHKNHEGPAVFHMLNKALEVACREKRVTEERNIRILIAQMHVVKGQLEEGLKQFQDLVNENPRDFRPYLCQGIIYSLLDRKKESAEQFETYRSLVPEEFPQRGFLDDVVLAAKTEAREQFQKEFDAELSYKNVITIKLLDKNLKATTIKYLSLSISLCSSREGLIMAHFASHLHTQNMAVNTLFLSFLLLIVVSAVAVSADDDCVYTVYVRTGSVIKGGTDSIISVRLYDAYGEYVEIPNLEAWAGLMGPEYNYFERGNLDIFSGRGPCLSAPVCAMNLTSDGTGHGSSWYCNYVEVTTTGAHAPCSQQLFTVEQWLSVKVSPYELTAIRNYCSSDLADLKSRRDRVRSSAAL